MPEFPVSKGGLPQRVVVRRRHGHLQHLRLVLLDGRLDEHGLVSWDDDSPGTLFPFVFVSLKFS